MDERSNKRRQRRQGYGGETGVERRQKGRRWKMRGASWGVGHNKTFIAASKCINTYPTYPPTHRPHPLLAVISLFSEGWGCCQDMTQTLLAQEERARSAGLLIIPLHPSAFRPYLHPGVLLSVWFSSSFFVSALTPSFYCWDCPTCALKRWKIRGLRQRETPKWQFGCVRSVQNFVLVNTMWDPGTKVT